MPTIAIVNGSTIGVEACMVSFLSVYGEPGLMRV